MATLQNLWILLFLLDQTRIPKVREWRIEKSFRFPAQDLRQENEIISEMICLMRKTLSQHQLMSLGHLE